LEEVWDEEDYNKMYLNNKLRYTLISAVSKNEFKKMCKLKTAKEMKMFVIES